MPDRGIIKLRDIGPSAKNIALLLFKQLEQLVLKFSQRLAFLKAFKAAFLRITIWRYTVGFFFFNSYVFRALFRALMFYVVRATTDNVQKVVILSDL